MDQSTGASTASTGVGPSTETYTNNSLNQISSLNSNSYTYDTADNLTATPAGLKLGYNAGNEVCYTATTTGSCTSPPTGATTYSYDTRGNRTTMTPPSPTAATTYTYDQANRLTAAGTTATYTYDGDGLRASKTVSSTTTPFTYDIAGNLPLLLTDGTHDYIYGPDGAPIEDITSTTPTYYHHDQQGSTRLLTDASGTITGTYTYDPYGNQTSHTGTATTPLGYNGQYTDGETGLVYLRARYYDPMTAQFISVDPLASLSEEPYSYVENDPLNGTDPQGLMCWSWRCAVNDAKHASVFVQAGADVVAVGAAAVGAEPIAGGALVVSEAAGAVNSAATCYQAYRGWGSSTRDCLTTIAISVGTAGIGEFLAPGEVRGSVRYFSQSDRVAQGGVNLFGDALGWAFDSHGRRSSGRGYCPGPSAISAN